MMLMSDEEYTGLVKKEGATYATLEAASRWLKKWREDHPDDDRDDMELLLKELVCNPTPEPGPGEGGG